MTTTETIELYKKACESGSCDLKSANLWLRQMRAGVQLRWLDRNKTIIKVEAA